MEPAITEPSAVTKSWTAVTALMRQTAHSTAIQVFSPAVTEHVFLGDMCVITTMTVETEVMS